MKIYLAGTPGIKERERQWQIKMNKRLLSFWNIIQKEFNIDYAFKLIKRQK